MGTSLKTVKKKQGDTMTRVLLTISVFVLPSKAKFNMTMFSDDSSRSLTGHQLENYFLPYGCYCNFDNNLFNKPHKGRGKPLDLWDEACKKLVDGYECAVQEFGPTCTPWNIDYGFAGTGTIPSVVEMICEALTRNMGGCARAACIVETTFANTIAELTIRGSQIGTTNISYINENYLHDANINYAALLCQGQPGEIHSDKSCCGADYPNKQPYKVEFRECCNGVITPFGTC